MYLKEWIDDKETKIGNELFLKGITSTSKKGFIGCSFDKGWIKVCCAENEGMERDEGRREMRVNWKILKNKINFCCLQRLCKEGGPFTNGEMFVLQQFVVIFPAKLLHTFKSWDVHSLQGAQTELQYLRGLITLIKQFRMRLTANMIKFPVDEAKMSFCLTCRIQDRFDEDIKVLSESSVARGEPSTDNKRETGLLLWAIGVTCDLDKFSFRPCSIIHTSSNNARPFHC